MIQTSRRLLFQGNVDTSTSYVIDARVNNLRLVGNGVGGIAKTGSGGTGCFDNNSTGEPGHADSANKDKESSVLAEAETACDTNR